ncbi:hypothetical protein AURANDRAFT_61396 [Aureococcus anophagefferens]|nr:hypothetical protein AURANDRAFT_61396 [Aureococcus anophagefferens]EGB12071.1 hypothetical protein AURANDRAFT_61396 [Aureococcus anophagefferens]|eukprot:XP_009033166.1 hypothetical protein AURANDRAFT_61396 [Aureococcus anophagefferens]
MSCDKWSSAHQVMHFDDVSTAEKVAETLDGAEVDLGGGQEVKAATATVLGARPESRFERQILVRHVKGEHAHNEVLAIVDEFIPEPEPCDLDGYGLRLVRFPSKIEALKAASALTGLEVDGSKIEAGVVGSVDEVRTLYRALHDLVPLDEATRHRTIVVSSASADAEVSSYTLGLEFDDVAEAKLAPAPAGTFQIGRVTFNSDAGFEKGRAVLDAGLRMGGSSVSGLAIELPLAEVLQKRVALLSDTLDELVQPQLKQATATVEVHDRKLEEEREAVLALHVRLDAIEEIARALDAKPKHREGADQGLVDDLVTRVDAVENRLDKVERRDPGESRPVEVAPAGGGPDAGELASTVTETIMAELERIGLLVAKESETIGRVYEVSDECLASTAIKHVDDLKKTVSAHSEELKDALAKLAAKLGKDEFAALCERHGDADNPLRPIFAYMRSLVSPLEEHKADRKELDARIVGLDTIVTARYEEALASERKRTLKLFADVNSNMDLVVGKVDVAERDVAAMKQQLLNDKLALHVAAQKVVDDDINGKIDAQHETLKKMEDALEDALKALEGTPNETTVRAMLSSLQDRIVSKLGGANAALSGEIASMKRELPRKVAREDVLRMLAKGIREVSEKLKSPDDAMMVGRVPYRCIACNNTSGMHDKQAAKVVHAGLSPVSATLPPDARGHHPVIVQAAYSTGRAGALRPLQRQGPAGIPVSR